MSSVPFYGDSVWAWMPGSPERVEGYYSARIIDCRIAFGDSLWKVKTDDGWFRDVRREEFITDADLWEGVNRG